MPFMWVDRMYTYVCRSSYIYLCFYYLDKILSTCKPIKFAHFLGDFLRRMIALYPCQDTWAEYFNLPGLQQFKCLSRDRNFLNLYILYEIYIYCVSLNI